MWESVLRFWFEENGPKQWWTGGAGFDAEIDRRFRGLHARAVSGELCSWREHPEGRLAEILVIDQFSRNLYRASPGAFAYDGIALILAQEAVRAKADVKLTIPRRNFVYLPYMHSESTQIHIEGERLMRERADANTHEYELKHKQIIDRFGRYPHRNAVLGRVSTPEEMAFLTEPGSSF